MISGVNCRRVASLEELEKLELYECLQAAIQNDLYGLDRLKTPADLVESPFGDDICKIYEYLFISGFSQVELAALEHSNYAMHLWPYLSLDAFPLIPNLRGDCRRIYERIKLATVMTCVWATIQEHNSGKGDWSDILQHMVKDHLGSFECVYYHAAQIWMLESWQKDLCDNRNFDDDGRLAILEQRALIKFFILCFRRFEVAGIRSCCVQLLSPAVWLHIPPSVRELAIYSKNKVAKNIFARVKSVLEQRYLQLDDKGDKLPQMARLNSVMDVYNVEHDFDNDCIEILGKRARYILNRDFMNSLLNQFVYILEDCIDLSVFANDDQGDDDNKVNDARDIMMHRIMLCENYLEFLIDLLSQLNTRRIIKPLSDNKLILTRCTQSELYQHLEGTLFKSLVDILEFYLRFYIDEELGTPIDYSKVLEQFYERFELFQKLCYTKLRHCTVLSQMHLLSPFECHQNDKLRELLSKCQTGTLAKLVVELGLLSPEDQTQNGVDSIDLLKPEASILVPVKPKRRKSAKLFLIDVIKSYLERPIDLLDYLNNTPLYPTEELLWTTSQLPNEYLSLSSLGIHKLNLQYLTLFDYLYKNFCLYRLETAYQIRMDLEEIIYSCDPRGYVTREPVANSFENTEGGKLVMTKFEGYHHMAIEIMSVEIRKINASDLMRSYGSYVEADIVIDTSRVREFATRKQWQSLRKHDVLFLVAVSAPLSNAERRLDKLEAPEEVPLMLGINLVRGAQLVQVTDEEGHILSDLNPYEQTKPIGFRLTLRVMLDYNQYCKDIEHNPHVYLGMNLLIRRDPKVNNFKAVLETLKKMINRPVKLPVWLYDIFLGFGDPQKCQYPQLEPKQWSIKMLDTFRTYGHFFSTTNSFVLSIAIINRSDDDFDNLTWEELEKRKILESNMKCSILQDFCGIGKNKCTEKETRAILTKLLGDSEGLSTECVDILKRVSSDKLFVKLRDKFYMVKINRSLLDDFVSGRKLLHPSRPDLAIKPQVLVLDPLVESESQLESLENTEHCQNEHIAPENSNRFEFTENQIECIRSGVSDGLTLIVGPPGTGKTDVICQIVGILFNNNPTERTVICTHSNYALNDIFEKLVLNGHVDEHHIVRLGGADYVIEGVGDFSKWGRVNYLLQKRLDLLELVKVLAESIGKFGDYHFNIQCSLLLFESFIIPVLNSEAKDTNVDSKKLFGDFFDRELEFTETCKDLNRFWIKAVGGNENEEWDKNVLNKVAFLMKFYSLLRGLQPFEVLRTNADRGNYLVERYARLVAMTCTHAAIAKESLEQLSYENLVMEEAAQIMEIETFVPLCSHLRRIVFCGDHRQLGPVIQNQCLSKYSNLNQSLFHRLIRLQVPLITLNKQARSRKEIADVYTPFYSQDVIESMPKVMEGIYLVRNPYFRWNLQFVDVVDGRESCPIRHFYQNLQEAEFLVATFMYMRSRGYDKDKIAILCAYNGQKALIEDIVKKKCSWNPQIGSPSVITTIDKFQGRQADFVLLSLVRTLRPGHLNDPRRLLVGISRARLGIYIFGNWRLFKASRHLTVFSEALEKYPKQLQILPDNDIDNVVTVDKATEMYGIVNIE